MVEFVGTWDSEIKSKSDPEKEWFWLETLRNLADMGTRKAVKLADMGEETENQNGMEWMNKPESEWGWGKYVNIEAGPIPAEELRKDMTRIATAVAVEESWPPYPLRVTLLGKLKRIYGYVMWFLARLKKTEGCESCPCKKRREKRRHLYRLVRLGSSKRRQNRCYWRRRRRSWGRSRNHLWLWRQRRWRGYWGR
jgi:hypothetical protein